MSGCQYKIQRTGDDVSALLDRIENLGLVTHEEDGLMSRCDKIKLDGMDIRYNTTSFWNRERDYVPHPGEIVIYSDYQVVVVEGRSVAVPGVKIGDGVKSVQQLEFIGSSDLQMLARHINDMIAHTTSAEKEYWNSKYSKPASGIPASDLAPGTIPDTSYFATRLELETGLSEKVDKVPGKGLSTNDYDDAEKASVASAYHKPSSGIPVSDLADGVVVVVRGEGLNSVQQKSSGAQATGEGSFAEGDGVASGDYSHAEGYGTESFAHYSHAEGLDTTADGEQSHAEGGYTIASGDCSHAEGNTTQATALHAHSEGWQTVASGANAHAEGRQTTSSGNASHAEGRSTTASEQNAHAEGYQSTASGANAHAEGYLTQATGHSAHAEGRQSVASGNYTHAEGRGTQATNEGEHAEGKFNAHHDDTIHSIGIGTSANDRKNAVEVTTDGREFVLGVGGYNGTNSDEAKHLAEVLMELGGVFQMTAVPPSGTYTEAQLNEYFDPADFNKARGGEYKFARIGVGEYYPLGANLLYLYIFTHDGIRAISVVEQTLRPGGAVSYNVTSAYVAFPTSAQMTAWSAKQDALVSGTNIKTVNNSSILGSGDLDVRDIFVAEYGETTISEVLAEIAAGKMVFANYNRCIFSLSYYEPGENNVPPDVVFFRISDDSELSVIHLTQDGWDNLYSIYPEDYSNKVNSLSAQSTHNEYPSAKCVYDALAGKSDKVTGATSGNLAGFDNGGNLVDSGYAGFDVGEVIIGTQGEATGSWTGVSKLPTATAFKSGYRFTYWLPYAGSGNATLTLTFQDNTTKSFNLYYKGASRLTTHISAGNKIDFLYLENANVNGTSYTGAWIDPGYQDGNNIDRIRSEYERKFIYSADTPLYRYKLCGFNNGKVVPLVITNQTDNTQLAKTPVSVGIDTSRGIVYYNSTTTVSSATTVIGAQTLYNEVPTTGCAYTFNESVPAYRDVYLKGTVKGDGLFYLDTTTHKSWYVFAPCRTSDGDYNSVFVDGCYYMFVGPTYSSANYLQLKYNNPVFQFLNGRLVPIDEKEDAVYESDEFYSRQSPNMQGRGVQMVSELRGRSIVWNQILKNGNFADGTTNWSGVYSASISASDGVLTVTNTVSSSSNHPVASQALTCLKNHKYLLRFDIKIETATTGACHLAFIYSATQYFDNNGVQRTDYADWKTEFGIVDANSDKTRIYIGAYNAGGDNFAVGDKAYLRNVALFDLTQMFGAGNEPSVEEFESLFPDVYYAYNAGTLISSVLTGVKTVGRNAWDEVWEVGSISSQGGVNSSNSNKIRSKNYIPVLSGQTYYGKAPSVGYAFFYDAEKNFISGQTPRVDDREISVPVGAAYMRFYVDGTTYNNNICINLSDPAFNGKYEPYKASTLPLNIPTMTSGGVSIFPDGMKSVGSVYDEAIADEDGVIRKVVKRIGKLVLNGTTNAVTGINTYTDANRFAYAGADDTTTFKPNSQYFSDKFVQIAYNGTVVPYAIQNTNGSGINRLWIYLPTTVSSNDAANTWLASNNATIFYELATPVEYTLDTPIYVGAKYYEGGTQSVVPEQVGTPTSAPFRGVVKYGLTTSEIVDKIPTVPTISTDVATDKADNTKTTGAKAVYDEIHPAVASIQPSGGFLPNILYTLGMLSVDTTFSLATPSDANIVNHYYWTFETGSTAPTITWPSGLSWIGGSAPTINASKHYEVSVLDNVAVAMEV